MAKTTRKHLRIRSIVTVSMCAAIITVSSWITVPLAVNFTLQTLAIFLISAVFDWKHSMLSVLVYILVGLCGIPVFSGFGAGPAALLGPTGGYIIGFLFIPPVIRLIMGNNKDIGKRKLICSFSMLMGLTVCYLFGTLWYCLGYGASSAVGFWSAISICVLPFIIPDFLKIFLAVLISARLEPINTKLNFNGGCHD